MARDVTTAPLGADCHRVEDSFASEEGPLLSSEQPHGQSTSWAVNVGVAAAYGAASVVTTLANKALLSSWGFDLVISLLFAQNILTVGVVLALKLLQAPRRSLDGAALSNELSFPLWEPGLALVMTPVMLVCSANLWCGMNALRLSSVPVYQTLKRMTPLPAMLLECAMRGKRYSPPVCLSVITVCLGAFLTGCGDLDMNARGYLFAIASCALQALYLVLASKASDARPLSSLAAAYYNSLLSLPLLVFGVAYEADELLAFASWGEPRFIAMLLLDLLLGASLSLLLFACTLVNSALTTTIVGNAKAVATTMLGAVLFGKVGLDTLGWVGVGLNTAGGVFYSLAKYAEKSPRSGHIGPAEAPRKLVR